MNRSNHRMSDYFLTTAEHKGVSLFPEGLLMYDLPSSRRGTSRTLSQNVELVKQSSASPVPSSSSVSSIGDEDLSIEDGETNKHNLTTSEDWWRQAIEPIPTKTLSISQSAFSMTDDDASNETNQLFSLLPSLNSHPQVIVHNQSLIPFKQIYSEQIVDHVQQMYERHSVPSLNILIKRGLLKIHKEKSIRMSINNKKTSYAQLDKNGKILSHGDNRLYETVEQFYQAYPFRRKRTDSLAIVYENVFYYNQSFHSILLEYAETILKVSGLKTRLIADEELFSTNDLSMENLSNEILCQINCWNEGRNEINLST